MTDVEPAVQMVVGGFETTAMSLEWGHPVREAAPPNGARSAPAEARETMMVGKMGAGKSDAGEYVAAGEGQGLTETFDASQVAAAFSVEIDRVHRAMAGEFNLGTDAAVTSLQAQQLAEVLLGDQPLSEREAATMQLGAFTPRRDQDWGMGDTAPGEESDRLAASADALDDERASRRSSFDPSQPSG